MFSSKSVSRRAPSPKKTTSSPPSAPPSSGASNESDTDFKVGASKTQATGTSASSMKTETLQSGLMNSDQTSSISTSEAKQKERDRLLEEAGDTVYKVIQYDKATGHHPLSRNKNKSKR